MNIYGLLIIAIAVLAFALLTGMTQPFGFLSEQFFMVLEPIKENNLAYNSVILFLVIAGLSLIVNWLFRRRNENSTQEEGRDRRGDSAGHEAGAGRVVQVPGQERANTRRRA